jgi:hypothetical protein
MIDRPGLGVVAALVAGSTAITDASRRSSAPAQLGM